jgi:hypothetical protein
MLLHASIDDLRRADRASALFALVGVVNVPIIYFSVRWWNTLHQGASVSMTAAPKMAATMLTAMLLMTVGFWMYSIAVILVRLRCVMLERNRQVRSTGAFEQGVKEVRAWWKCLRFSRHGGAMVSMCVVFGATALCMIWEVMSLRRRQGTALRIESSEEKE